MLAARRIRSPVLAHFAVQLGGWGLVLGLIGAMEWHGLHLRDLAGATRLERATWVHIGFDVGVIGMGAVLAVASRWFGAKPGGRWALGPVSRCRASRFSFIDLQLVAAVSR